MKIVEVNGEVPGMEGLEDQQDNTDSNNTQMSLGEIEDQQVLQSPQREVMQEEYKFSPEATVVPPRRSIFDNSQIQESPFDNSKQNDDMMGVFDIKKVEDDK